MRTLHYYDRIGLLKPSSYGANGYRYYDEDAAPMLQQVLFFRELGFTLEETRRIVANPGFEAREALEEHRVLLEKQAARIAELLETVDRTIKGLQGGIGMEIKEYYQGFSDSQIDEYRKEVRQRWGEDVLRDSESRVLKMGKEGMAAVQAEGGGVFEMLARLVPLGAGSPEVQEQVGRWREWLEHFATYSDEAVLGLGRMYSEDSRFVEFFSKYGKGFPAFFTKAIEYYCATGVRQG